LAYIVKAHNNNYCMLRYYSYRNRKTIYPIHKQSLQPGQVVSDHQKKRLLAHGNQWEIERRQCTKIVFFNEL